MKTRRSKRKTNRTIKKGGVYTTKDGKVVIKKNEFKLLPQYVQKIFKERKSNPEEFKYVKRNPKSDKNLNLRDITEAEIKKFIEKNPTLYNTKLDRKLLMKVDDKYKYYATAEVADIIKLQEMFILLSFIENDKSYTGVANFNYLSRICDIIISKHPELKHEIHTFITNMRNNKNMRKMYENIDTKLNEEVNKKTESGRRPSRWLNGNTSEELTYVKNSIISKDPINVNLSKTPKKSSMKPYRINETKRNNSNF